MSFADFSAAPASPSASLPSAGLRVVRFASAPFGSVCTVSSLFDAWPLVLGWYLVMRLTAETRRLLDFLEEPCEFLSDFGIMRFAGADVLKCRHRSPS